MPLTEELRDAVIANPDDDAPRIASMNALAIQPDASDIALARFIHVQLELVRLGDGGTHDERFDLLYDEVRLPQEHRSSWAAPIAPLVENYEFDRGFVELIELPASHFLERGDPLFSLAPIRHLRLSEVGGLAEALFSDPHLARIRSLQMDRCGLGDRDLAMLARSPHLRELRWLSVAENDINSEGIDALASSTSLEKLSFANFFGNPCDPGEQHSNDNDQIMLRWLPEEGELIEATHGRVEWLHRDVNTIEELTPDRFRG